MFCLLDTGQSTNEREPFDVVGSKFRPGSPPKRIGSTTVAGVNVTNESLRVPADVAPAGGSAVAAVSVASASAEMAAGMRDMGPSGLCSWCGDSAPCADGRSATRGRVAFRGKSSPALARDPGDGAARRVRVEVGAADAV